MKILGLITARGGSKGIPGKNIKFLGGNPLISYVIKDGLASNHLDRLIVSTDSEDIVKIARHFGAEVPFLRPASLAHDNTPTIDVVIHAIEFFEKQKEFFDAVCLLQPTSPFKPEGFIDDCIQKFIRSDADSLISVLKVPHHFNPHWTFLRDNDGFLKISTGEHTLIPRRQDLPEAFYRDGSVYISKVDLIKSENQLVGKEVAFFESDKDFYANLDSIEDWKAAELKLKNIYFDD